MARARFIVPFAVVSMAAIGGFGWLAYERIVDGVPSPVPLIRADDNPTKKRPEDPGGLVVPDQDKLIYQALNGDVVEETVERLLPPPEEPLPAPEPPREVEAVEEIEEKPAAATVPKPSGIPALPPAEITPGAEQPPQADAPEAPDAPEAVEAPAPVPPKPEPEAAQQPELVQQPEAPPPAASGPYLVQIASFRTIDEADRAWRRAVKKNGDILSAHSAQVVRADLGVDKGIFYRLRIGSFTESGEAKALCRKLKARNIDCIVVRP